MTIAAGLLCQDGVLICADTEHTGWASKTHQIKIGDFELPATGAKICFALAGATAPAWSAIEKCRKALLDDSTGDLPSRIEAILDSEYRRNVATLPSYSDFDYQLLVGLWEPGSHAVKLYSTTATTFVPVREFACIGIGGELASFIIRPAFVGLTLRQALPLSIYTLACVKDAIAGCGGMSIYHLIRNDGSVGTISSGHLGTTVNVEQYSKTFDFMTRRLLLLLADTDMDENTFRGNLDSLFIGPLVQKRREWVKAHRKYLADLAKANPHLTEEQVKNAAKDLSLGFSPNFPIPEN